MVAHIWIIGGESLLELDLVELVAHYLQLVAGRVVDSQELAAGEAGVVKGRVCHSEVAEELLLLRPQPQLGVAKQEEELVVGHHQVLCVLSHLETLVEGEVEEEAPAHSLLLGLLLVQLGEGVAGEPSHCYVVDEPDHDQHVLLLVDKVVEIEGVSGVVLVEQLRLNDVVVCEGFNFLEEEIDLVPGDHLAIAKEFCLVEPAFEPAESGGEGAVGFLVVELDLFLAHVEGKFRKEFAVDLSEGLFGDAEVPKFLIGLVEVGLGGGEIFALLLQVCGQVEVLALFSLERGAGVFQLC